MTRAGEILDRIPTIADFFVPKTEMRRRSDESWQRNPPPTHPSLRGRGEGGGTPPILSVDFSQENLEGVTLYSGSRENGAFRFTDAESRIRLQSLGNLSSFTVLIDVKVDQLRGGFNPILMSEQEKSGGILWNIRASGAMVCGFHRTKTSASKTVETPIVFTNELLKEWGRLGLAFDKEAGRMSVYLNGNLICTKKLSNRRTPDLNEVDIGNWRLKTDNVDHLDGAVKNIMVFDRALELNEIRNR